MCAGDAEEDLPWCTGRLRRDRCAGTSLTDVPPWTKRRVRVVATLAVLAPSLLHEGELACDTPARGSPCTVDITSCRPFAAPLVRDITPAAVAGRVGTVATGRAGRETVDFALRCAGLALRALRFVARLVGCCLSRGLSNSSGGTLSTAGASPCTVSTSGTGCGGGVSLAGPRAPSPGASTAASGGGLSGLATSVRIGLGTTASGAADVGAAAPGCAR